jgi:hypothetical protein
VKFFSACFVFAAALPLVAADNWLLTLGADSAITASTSEQDLIRRYGSQNVQDKSVDTGEGDIEPVTILYPNDLKRKLTIQWKDPGTRQNPSFLTITGRTSLWHSVHAISLGTSLKQIELINNKPFVLEGMGVEYSGTVVSWEGGTLDRDLKSNGRVVLRLDHTGPLTGAQRQANDKLQGDRPFSSNNPAMRDYKPLVYEIIWQFP